MFLNILSENSHGDVRPAQVPRPLPSTLSDSYRLIKLLYITEITNQASKNLICIFLASVLKEIRVHKRCVYMH